MRMPQSIRRVPQLGLCRATIREVCEAKPYVCPGIFLLG
jgi:ribosomal protein S14